MLSDFCGVSIICILFLDFARFVIECLETKQSLGQSHVTPAMQRTNQHSKQLHAADEKRGKTCVSELHSIGFGFTSN